MLNLIAGLVTFIPTVGPALSDVLAAASIVGGSGDGQAADSTIVASAEAHGSDVLNAVTKARSAAVDLAVGVSLL